MSDDIYSQLRSALLGALTPVNVSEASINKNVSDTTEKTKLSKLFSDVVSEKAAAKDAYEKIFTRKLRIFQSALSHECGLYLLAKANSALADYESLVSKYKKVDSLNSMGLDNLGNDTPLGAALSEKISTVLSDLQSPNITSDANGMTDSSRNGYEASNWAFSLIETYSYVSGVTSGTTTLTDKDFYLKNYKNPKSVTYADIFPVGTVFSGKITKGDTDTSLRVSLKATLTTSSLVEDHGTIEGTLEKDSSGKYKGAIRITPNIDGFVYDAKRIGGTKTESADVTYHNGYYEDSDKFGDGLSTLEIDAASKTISIQIVGNTDSAQKDSAGNGIISNISETLAISGTYADRSTAKLTSDEIASDPDYSVISAMTAYKLDKSSSNAYSMASAINSYFSKEKERIVGKISDINDYALSYLTLESYRSGSDPNYDATLQQDLQTDMQAINTAYLGDTALSTESIDKVVSAMDDSIKPALSEAYSKCVSDLTEMAESIFRIDRFLNKYIPIFGYMSDLESEFSDSVDALEGGISAILANVTGYFSGKEFRNPFSYAGFYKTDSESASPWKDIFDASIPGIGIFDSYAIYIGKKFARALYYDASSQIDGDLLLRFSNMTIERMASDGLIPESMLRLSYSNQEAAKSILSSEYGIEMEKDIDSERISSTIKLALPKLESLDSLAISPVIAAKTDAEFESEYSKYEKRMEFEIIREIAGNKGDIGTIVKRLVESFSASSYNIKTIMTQNAILRVFSEFLASAPTPEESILPYSVYSAMKSLAESKKYSQFWTSENVELKSPTAAVDGVDLASNGETFDAYMIGVASTTSSVRYILGSSNSSSVKKIVSYPTILSTGKEIDSISDKKFIITGSGESRHAYYLAASSVPNIYDANKSLISEYRTIYRSIYSSGASDDACLKALNYDSNDKSDAFSDLCDLLYI